MQLDHRNLDEAGLCRFRKGFSVAAVNLKSELECGNRTRTRYLL